ncbi:EscU/YscU/HrcU family type III secretion system export apparatus switch protein [Desulfogranum mediterraneum]|uniref:EscU/YscU/HrcU family type III secretion system export apparatus switch protein n=1 Tax=Desulfogranum mediterraneum TaxID=160661 RepID=UPI000401F455|nr:EscU/YscU/HrcU family type III secretion system export apparatus switch protein [Desulfogranum mediterraneum]
MEKKEKQDKAVALRYDEQKRNAPEVVASGSGIVAQKIIESAQVAGVFIKEDPDLVELLAKVPVGEEIPAELYQTVAEVLAFVYSVNSKFKEKVPPPRSENSQPTPEN